MKRWRVIISMAAVTGVAAFFIVNNYQRDLRRCSLDDLRQPGQLIVGSSRHTYGRRRR
jgi:hypothetical protein